jgi:hypothetical protein
VVITLSELGHICKCFLAVYGDGFAVFGGILADNGLKVTVTFEVFRGVQGYSLSYIKRISTRDLSMPAERAPQRWRQRVWVSPLP